SSAPALRLLARDNRTPRASALVTPVAATEPEERLMLVGVDWAGVAQQVVAGLSSGGTYATLAVALVLIYRATGVVNFAQGELAMFSTFVAWTLTRHGFAYWPAFLVTVLASFAGGIALERAVIRPVERASVLTIAIVTIGLFFIVNGAAFWIWSPEVKSMPNAFSTRPIRIGGVAFAISDLGIIGVFLNLLGTYVSWVGTDLRQAAALAVILGVLLVRPAGLFGKLAVRRV